MTSFRGEIFTRFTIDSLSSFTGETSFNSNSKYFDSVNQPLLPLPSHSASLEENILKMLHIYHVYVCMWWDRRLFFNWKIGCRTFCDSLPFPLYEAIQMWSGWEDGDYFVRVCAWGNNFKLLSFIERHICFYATYKSIKAHIKLKMILELKLLHQGRLDLSERPIE